MSGNLGKGALVALFAIAGGTGVFFALKVQDQDQEMRKSAIERNGIEVSMAALKGSNLRDIHLDGPVHGVFDCSSRRTKGVDFTAKNLNGETVHGVVTFQPHSYPLSTYDKGATVTFKP